MVVENSAGTLWIIVYQRCASCSPTWHNNTIPRDLMQHLQGLFRSITTNNACFVGGCCYCDKLWHHNHHSLITQDGCSSQKPSNIATEGIEYVCKNLWGSWNIADYALCHPFYRCVCGGSWQLHWSSLIVTVRASY